MRISQYPNTATLAPGDLFIIASGATNKNISWDQLSNLVFNLVPVSYTNVNVSSIDSVRPTNGIVMVNQGALTQTVDHVTAYIAGTNSDGSITVRPQASTNTVTQGAAGTSAWPVVGSITNFNLRVVSASWNIPTATTYASGQVCSGDNNVAGIPMTLSGVHWNTGGSGIIKKIRWVTSTNNWTPSANLVLYNATNVTAFSNSQALSLWYTNRVARQGIIPLAVMSTEGAGDCSMTLNVDNSVPFPFQCAVGDTNLYFFLEMKAAATSYPNQTNYLEITVEPR